MKEQEAPGVGMMITKEMEEEEEKLTENAEKKEKEMMEKARESMEKDTHDVRFKRLQHLLEKSNIYSKFLLTKMEQQQQQEEKVKKERRQKKSQNDTKNDVPAKDKTASKKRTREDYKISDIMSKEEIESKAKKSKLKEEVMLVHVVPS
ncbi:hypothetical protein CRUP_015537 [Coryphaenoides rupestris]|nr:hypothetical protein CRUP_015537 [Coryphaenoides rupestris]